MIQLFTNWRCLIVILALAVTANCGQASERLDANELRVGIEDHPRTLDPRYATDAYGQRIGQHLIFSTLVKHGYDLQPVPDLALRWENPEDHITVVHLRQDAQFHDGTPVTGKDVKFTYEHLMDPGTLSPFASRLRSIIDSIELEDPHTVRFIQKMPVASFLNMITAPILPKHLIENGEDFSQTLTGSGPFQFVSQSATEIVLSPNEHYYGGKPQMERLSFKVIRDDNTRFLKMRRGELDLAINALPLDKVDEFRKPPLSDTYRLIEGPGISYNYVAFNLEDPLLQDVRVRRAIAHAINVEEIIQYRLAGQATRAVSLLSPINPYHDASVPAVPFDPQKSRKLLESTGLVGSGQAGETSRLNLQLKVSNNAQAVAIGRILQAQLAVIGIDLDLRSYEWGTFYGDIRSGNFQMTTMRWVGVVDPDFYYELFHSRQMAPQGDNRVRYADAEMDQLLETGRVTLEPLKRKAIYSQVQKKLAEDLPYFSLWHVNNVSIVHKRVSGYRQHPSGGFQSFRDVTLSPF